MKLFLALALLGISAHAQTITGSGGTLKAPTAIGQPITVTAVQIGVQLGAGTAELTCPVTYFWPSTYQWNWVCGPGVLVINGDKFDITSATMTLQCSGGGRAHVTTCWHRLSGTLTDGGIVSVSSKGATNNASSAVVAFAASW